MKTNINGNEIEISVRDHQTRFGTVYVASNSYGEPKQTIKAFRTAAEAVANEKLELEQMFA